MGHLDPIAYTYEADYHCPDCATSRFGEDELGFVPFDAEDDEGNPVGAVAPWDEWYDIENDQCEALVCGTCGTWITECHKISCYQIDGKCDLEGVKHG